MDPNHHCGGCKLDHLDHYADHAAIGIGNRLLGVIKNQLFTQFLDIHLSGAVGLLVDYALDPLGAGSSYGTALTNIDNLAYIVYAGLFLTPSESDDWH